jgi:hypothetical protein
MRSPWEPVSTWTLSTVAQLLVPGTHTVTLVVGILRVRQGAALTAMGWVLGVLDWGMAAGLLAGAVARGALAALDAAAGAPPLALLVAPPPPPPPQAASTL